MCNSYIVSGKKGSLRKEKCIIEMQYIVLYSLGKGTASDVEMTEPSYVTEESSYDMISLTCILDNTKYIIYSGDISWSYLLPLKRMYNGIFNMYTLLPLKICISKNPCIYCLSSPSIIYTISFPFYIHTKRSLSSNRLLK